MYTVHLGSLGMIHNFQCIADIESRQCPAYEMKNPLKQGAMDRSFLLDTVRHISRPIISVSSYKIDLVNG